MLPNPSPITIMIYYYYCYIFDSFTPITCFVIAACFICRCSVLSLRLRPTCFKLIIIKLITIDFHKVLILISFAENTPSSMPIAKVVKTCRYDACVRVQMTAIADDDTMANAWVH